MLVAAAAAPPGEPLCGGRLLQLRVSTLGSPEKMADNARVTQDELLNEYRSLLPQLQDFRVRVVSALASALPADIQIRSRVKAWESIAANIKQLDIRSLGELQDLIGIRVIVPSAELLSNTQDALARNFLITLSSTLHLRPWSEAHYVVRSGASLTDGIAAEIQIVTAAQEAFRILEHESRYILAREGARADQPANLVASLEATIAEFESLITRPDVHEKRDIHPFLIKHNFLLFPNPDSILSERPIGLGTEFRIDFMIHRADGTYLLVEIENPQHRLFNEKGEFTPAFNHALRQVEDWQEWIESNLPTVERYYPGMSAPEAAVIIGRNVHLTPAERKRLTRRNINMRGHVTIRTYDDLVAEARAYVKSVRGALGRH
jgi:ppGpp synthetase/RelA/SpoT-type nucleotidyltranferase